MEFEFYDVLKNRVILGNLFVSDEDKQIRIDVKFSNYNLCIVSNYLSTALFKLVKLLKTRGYIICINVSRKDIYVTGMVTDMSNGNLVYVYPGNSTINILDKVDLKNIYFVMELNLIQKWVLRLFRFVQKNNIYVEIFSMEFNKVKSIKEKLYDFFLMHCTLHDNYTKESPE